MSSSAAAPSIIYVGMDVHKDSITLAVLPAAAKNPTRLERLPNDLPKLKRFLDRLARDGELRCCYEASGAGYVLHRALREWGYLCDVIAPSLIPKRSGVQRKHDKRDAADLARLLSRGRAHRRAHPERSRRASARRGAVPRDLPARDPQVTALHREVPRSTRLRVSRGDQLVYAAREVAAASHHRR